MRTVLLHIFNKEFLESQNLLVIFKIAAFFELIFSIFALFLVILSLYIATSTPQFHKNLLYLIYIFGLQYFISTSAKTGINFAQFYGDNYRMPINMFIKGLTIFLEINETLLFSLILSRSFCIFLATYSMPGMVAERVFATILIKDYEFNPRKWIFMIIATFEFAFSFVSVYLFYYENVPEIYFLTFILFLDVAAFIIYLICEYINLRRYHRYFRTDSNCFSKKHVMSLSERFQLAENIKSSMVFKPLAVLVTIFNVMLVAIGLAKPLNLGIFAKHVIYLLFELNIVVYAVCVPSITLLRNQIWRGQIYHIFLRIPIIRRCLPKTEMTPTVHLRNSFGKNMILNVDRQQNYYFKELNKSWNNGQTS